MEKNLHKYGECGEKFSKNHKLHAGLRPVGWDQERGETLCEMTGSVSFLHPGLQGESPVSMSGRGWGGWVLERQITSDNPEESQPCCRYRKPFSFLSALPWHGVAQGAGKPWECEECGNCIYHPSSLTQHRALLEISPVLWKLVQVSTFAWNKIISTLDVGGGAHKTFEYKWLGKSF